MKREESRHDFAFLAGVVIGAVAGAMATLAMSPQTGADARDKFRARMNDLDVEGYKERARNAANAGAERVKGLAGEDTSPGQMIASTKAKVADIVERSPLPVGGKNGELGEDAELAAERPRTVHEAEPFKDAVRDAEGGVEDAAQRAANAAEGGADDAAKKADDAANAVEESAADAAQQAADAVEEHKPGQS